MRTFSDLRTAVSENRVVIADHEQTITAQAETLAQHEAMINGQAAEVSALQDAVSTLAGKLNQVLGILGL